MGAPPNDATWQYAKGQLQQARRAVEVAGRRLRQMGHLDDDHREMVREALERNREVLDELRDFLGGEAALAQREARRLERLTQDPGLCAGCTKRRAKWTLTLELQQSGYGREAGERETHNFCGWCRREKIRYDWPWRIVEERPFEATVGSGA